MEVDVEWSENSEEPYPTEMILGIYNYTGSYKFVGEFDLPPDVINPWGLDTEIYVKIYPTVIDPYYPDLDYSEWDREIEGSADNYTVWYEDVSGKKQGAWENYRGGVLTKEILIIITNSMGFRKNLQVLKIL